MSEKKLHFITQEEKKQYKKYMVVKVGDETTPYSEEAVGVAKDKLTNVMENSGEEFEWVFVPSYVNIEALVFEKID